MNNPDKTTPRVGTIIDASATRDAIHVAVAPMLATRVMKPGERLVSGIVDPYLREDVQVGQWYYLWLYPGTITSLRHVWSHPAFGEEAKS